MEENKPFVKEIKLKKWQKGLCIAGAVILCIVFIVSFLIKQVGTTEKADTLFDELNKTYVQSSILTDVYSNEDVNSMKQKLQNAGALFNTSGNLEQVSETFAFSSDIELTEKEFCALFNAFGSSVENGEDFVLKQTEISVNGNNANIVLSYVIKPSLLSSFNLLNQTLNQDITLVNNVKKYVNSNNTISTSTISVNGLTSETATSNIKTMFFEGSAIEVVDAVLEALCDEFNCDYVLINNGIKILA